MPFFEQCLHCGTKTELTEEVLLKLRIRGIPPADSFTYEPCLACGVENAKIIRFWVYPVTKSYKELDDGHDH